MSAQLSQHVLAAKLSEAAPLVTIGADYLHYKDKKYKVLNLVIFDEDTDVLVIYRALYGEGVVFARRLSSWLDSVEVAGETRKRFSKL